MSFASVSIPLSVRSSVIRCLRLAVKGAMNENWSFWLNWFIRLRIIIAGHRFVTVKSVWLYARLSEHCDSTNSLHYTSWLNCFVCGSKTFMLNLRMHQSSGTRFKPEYNAKYIFIYADFLIRTQRRLFYLSHLSKSIYQNVHTNTPKHFNDNRIQSTFQYCCNQVSLHI